MYLQTQSMTHVGRCGLFLTVCDGLVANFIERASSRHPARLVGRAWHSLAELTAAAAALHKVISLA